MASCKPQATMTPERFQKLVDTPGDNVPLVPQLTNGSPVWPYAEITLVLNYTTGRVLTQRLEGASKTIGGQYVVHTMQADFLKEPLYSIFTYEEKSGQFKEYGCYSNTVTEAIISFDAKNRTFASTASFATSFTETATGSWTETNETAHIVINKNGALFMTRDETTHPVSIPK